MIDTPVAATAAVVHTAHEGLTLTVGLLVWAAGAVFLGVSVAERRGSFRDRAPVRFDRWASVVAAGLSLGAAAIHFSVVGIHYAEYPPNGVLFVILAWAQAAWAVTYLIRPVRRLAVAAVVGNAGVVAVWAVSRTMGLPFGPTPFVPEPAGLLDVLATAFELALVALLIIALSGRWRTLRLSPALATAYSGAALAVSVVLTSVSLAAGGHGLEAAHTHEAGITHGHEEASDPSSSATSATSSPLLSDALTDSSGASLDSGSRSASPEAPEPSTVPASSASLAPAAMPTGLPRPAIPGSIDFGSGIDVAGVLEPARRFRAGEHAVWIARFAAPPETRELRFVVHQVLADGREFEHWAQTISIADPSSTTLVGMADLATFAHGGAGTYRMSYLRGDDVLAEGRFDLIP
jgi:hypothetical protein